MHSSQFQSPVSQDFVWVAEYADGTECWEFDPITKEENPFWAIRRKDLIRFGLVGLGLKMYFEVFGGYFKVAGQLVELSYVVGDQVHPLTGHWQAYNNILTFKQASADFSEYGRMKRPQIHEYSFGYEHEVMIGDVKATIRALCHLPFQQPCHFTFQITAEQPLDGKFRVHKNKKTDEFEAELSPDETGILTWTFTM